MNGSLVLGIDVGSVSINLILMSTDSRILKRKYIIHKGNILHFLQEELSEIDLSRVKQICFNSSSQEFFRQGLPIHDQIALIEGARSLANPIGSLFTIGGASFGLIQFDKNGTYQKFISNTSCAAGTGAFLDQQAQRLGLKDSAELSQLAESFSGEPPKIATRCAVFAKTDLIHSQQQGYSVAAIAAGLCKGLAHNVADTLIKSANLPAPAVAVGGVSLNKKVVHYLSEITRTPIFVPEDAVFASAIGLARIAKQKFENGETISATSSAEIINLDEKSRSYFFPPLRSELSHFPNFDSEKRFVSHDVETDIYHLPQDKKKIPVYLGIDIGSTSTKATVMQIDDDKNSILLGLYTRTMGQPIRATQALFRVIREIEKEYHIRFDVRGVGTTGSGRKFIQKVIGADMAVDEITAHARAAYELNPNTDTIIEIGGQDSKFTVMKNGRVSFSVMNYVCAAGTGSFIEEQAKRLNVSLDEYSDLAAGTASPLTSDRCTVFMERDLNHLMSQGYSKRELLAAVLHSVRDNYLSKVAHLNKIGDVICFQGATAKNKALVMAFEQKLKKPIFVSKYCHLTGALGVCLLLKEQNIQKSAFRGIKFYKQKISITEEVCDGCKNHCKLNKLTLGKEELRWGYLCGREDDESSAIETKKFDLITNRQKIFNAEGQVIKSSYRTDLKEEKLFDLEDSIEKLKEKFGVNLLALRHQLFKFNLGETPDNVSKKQIRIGIPNTIYMTEYVPFWKYFFRKLGYQVIVSRSSAKMLNKGKELAAAEFCAPMANWHAHILQLQERADFIFLPHMPDADEHGDRQRFCYYSNYAIPIIQNNENFAIDDKAIVPIINFSAPAIENVQQIYENLPPELKILQTPNELLEAFQEAWQWFNLRRSQLVEFFKQQNKDRQDISVVLLGRPYLVTDAVMNKNIPEKLAKMGIPTFFQDMLPISEEQPDPSFQEFFEWNHWKYGAEILQAAHYCAQHTNLYPVFLTAFKCSPDSFVLQYLREMMDAYHLPYLVLQLDEHGSDVGYETRLEAAVRSFRNHFQERRTQPTKRKPSRISRKPIPHGNVLIPNFDYLTCSLISAAFEHAGYKTYLIEETQETIASSIRLNDGQCLPISAIAQSAAETIKKHELEPEKTSIFLNAISRLSCNLPQYPLMAKKLLEQLGNGFEKVQIFATEFEMRGCPIEVVYDVYCSYLLGGLLRRLACKIRPYEIVPGQTDKWLEKSREKLYRTLAEGKSKDLAFREIVAELSRIPVVENVGKRVKVAIIGDLYVRDNDVFNQQLTRELEKHGAEVVTTPYTFILRMLAGRHTHHLRAEGRYLALIRDKLLLDVLEKFEKRFFLIANEILGEEFPVFDESIYDVLKKYKIMGYHSGETAQNILKVFHLKEHYPDLALIVHINPIFCCPGLVSEAVFEKVEKDIGIPIVSIIYDGTSENKNEVLVPYLHFIQEKTEKVAHVAN